MRLQFDSLDILKCSCEKILQGETTLRLQSLDHWVKQKLSNKESIGGRENEL